MSEPRRKLQVPVGCQVRLLDLLIGLELATIPDKLMVRYESLLSKN